MKLRKYLRKILLYENKAFDEVKQQRHKAHEALTNEIVDTQTRLAKTQPNYLHSAK